MKKLQNPNNSFRHEVYHLSLVVGLALLAMFPSFWLGTPFGNDLPQHIRFAETYRTAILSGDFFPSWTLSENLGFGSLGVRFYPPLFEFTVGLIQTFTNDWHLSIWLVCFFLMALSGLGIYGWAREFFVPRFALLAAACYIFVPYHLNQYYNASMLGEFASNAFLPFCFWFVWRICRYRNLSDIIGLSIAYTLLILSHLPILVIGSISLLIYSLVSLPKQDFLRKIINLAASVTFGLCAGAFFWWKVVTEMPWLKHAQDGTERAFNFGINFLLASLNDFQGLANYTSEYNPFDRGLAFTNFMLVTVLFAILPLAFVIWRKPLTEVRQKFFGVMVVFIFSIFMATPASYFLWNNLNFLQQTQFPWRWLSIFSLFGSLLLALTIQVFTQQDFSVSGFPKKLANYFIFVPLTFTIILVVGTAGYIPPDKIEEAKQRFTNGRGVHYWWPVWTSFENYPMENSEKVTAHNRNVEIQLWQTNERTFTVSSGEANEIRIGTFYYPHWQATVNDIPTAIKPAADGTILIPAPAENAVVKLRFVEPLGVKVAFIVSVLMWIFLLVTGLISVRAQLKNWPLTNNLIQTGQESVQPAEV